jgi:hypothetical protein
LAGHIKKRVVVRRGGYALLTFDAVQLAIA